MLKLLVLLIAFLVPALAQTPASLDWSPVAKDGKFGISIRLYSVHPEVEVFVITIRYQLAGDTVIREQKRAILRCSEDGVTTDYYLATSGPAYVVQSRVREMVVGGDGELVANW